MATCFKTPIVKQLDSGRILQGGYVGLVWTALGLVMVTSNVRAEQVRADNYKKNDVQTDVLISPIDALVGARIYILDDDGMIMDFDTDGLEMEDISWALMMTAIYSSSPTPRTRQ